jgi:hypothetical protein
MNHHLMQFKDTKPLRVLEGALKLDKEWNFGTVVQAQYGEHFFFPFYVLPLSLPQYVPLLTYFNCEQRKMTAISLNFSHFTCL